MFFSLHRILFLLSFTIISAAGYGQVAESQQALEDQYQNKIFLLRGFYSDSFLHFQATGVPMGTPVPGDWTVDGFVLISRMQIHEARLELEARRLFVVSDGRTFRFQAATPKKKKKAEILKIEVELAPGDTSGGVAAQFSKIFLTDRDSLAALVPDYWEACVSAALEPASDQKYAYCHFATELMAVAGMTPRPHRQTSSVPDGASSAETYQFRLYHPGKGISAPKPIFSPEPEFSDAARRTNWQGVVTLGVVVDSRGIPRNVHILAPLGCGLDDEAVRTVRTWRFKPAEQEGHDPVPVEIAVEVDFHLR